MSKTKRNLSEAGRLFQTSIASAANLADNGTLVLAFTTPAAGLFVVQEMVCDAKVLAKFELLQGPTVASGTAKTAVNLSRTGSPRASTMTGVEQDGTISADGTVLATSVVTPTGLKGDNPWILKPSTKYAIRVTNLAGATSFVGTRITWSEE
jgi:hypothetical protein